MSRPRSFHAEVRELLHDRILDRARDLVIEHGWSAVNMSRVARDVGISRAGLYKEIGAREDLATALIVREADRFLDGVVQAFTDAPDVIDGMAAAAGRALAIGDENALLLSIIGGGHGDSELLSIVAVDPEAVLGRAMQVVTEQLRLHLPHLDDFALGSITEAFVRLTISHLLQPRGTRHDAITQIRAVAHALLITPPVTRRP